MTIGQRPFRQLAAKSAERADFPFAGDQAMLVTQQQLREQLHDRSEQV